MNIWIVNPFDQLPNETDVPLRYWSLCKTFAMQGHNVIWWSSDYSHLTKTKREPCLDTDGFSIRLIETPPYKKNISFARLRNHNAFANGFYREAMKSMENKEMEAPDRIVVSLPPLGVAEQAFKIRNQINHSLSTTSPGSCQVVVDIMDAWPETFYQLIPKPLNNFLGPLLFSGLRRSSKRAYYYADKISAVGQSYLELSKRYGAKSPMHLCYHGTDLSRFSQKQHLPTRTGFLKAVYLGAMGSGYDLQTLIDVAKRWKAEGQFLWQIHFAGEGAQLTSLKAQSQALGLDIDERVIIHDYLQKGAVEKLLGSVDIALVPNCPSSLVACPYKAGEYAAAGLPMLSCLGGELNQLLAHWDAGSAYKEGDAASLQAAFENYTSNPQVLKQQSLNARNMAEALFDREQSYQQMIEFFLT